MLAYYYQRKYAGFGQAVRLASGLEARYLLAEAELKLGDPARAVTSPEPTAPPRPRIQGEP